MIAEQAMPTSLLLDSLLRSVQVGSLYALMALGITLTFTVLKLPNFAHAEYITVGAYAALILSLSGVSSLPVVLLFAFIVAAVTALLAHLTVFRPLEKQSPKLPTLLLASFSVGLILRYIVFLVVDYYDLFDQRIQVPLQILYRSPVLILTNIFVWVVPTSILLVILLHVLLQRTPLGREMRALANNAMLARVIGIRVEQVKILTWLLVGGLAGVAGALWGINTSLTPLMGWLAILSAFAAAILGGLSSFPGTILGAYVVGFSENTLMQVLNFYFGLDFSFKPAIPFLIIVLVLLLRPQGFTELLTARLKLQR